MPSESSARSARLLQRTAIAVFVIMVLAGHAVPAPAEGLGRFERQRMHMMLRMIKDDLVKYYYDPAYHDIDIDQSFAAAEKKIESATSNGQCFAAMARPLLALKDSHTYFRPPGRSVRVKYGWAMQMVGDRCQVMAVQEGSDAEAKGLKRGDLVLTVNGHRPTRDNLWGLRYVFNILAPRGSMDLEVQTPSGEKRQLQVTAELEEKKRLMDLTRGADVEDYWRELEDQAWLGRHRTQEFGDELLIWRMPAFDMDPGEVKSAMRTVDKHAALILDLRGNGGGSVEMLEHLVGSFIEGGVTIGDVQSRERMKPVVAKKLGKPYEGKLVVLVDSGSASASELFARVMQLEKRGTVIGDRTSGAVMMSRYYGRDIGSDTKIFFGTSITIADIIMKDGRSLEHVGVIPDEVILPTEDDLAGGRDPVLVRAAELCGVALTPEKAGSLFPIEWER